MSKEYVTLTREELEAFAKEVEVTYEDGSHEVGKVEKK